MKFTKWSSVLVFLIALSGCIQEPKITPTTPTVPTVPITAAQRINYASASNRQHFDFYTAANDANPRPLVLYVHGGAWVFGPEASSYESYIKSTLDFPAKNFAQTLVNNGFAVAIMKYREPKYILKSTPTADIPYASSALSDIMNDIDAAIAKLVEQSATLRIDTSRIGILGDSAGAHLVSMYAYGSTPNQYRIKTVVTFYGPYDLSQPDVTPSFYSYSYNGKNPTLFPSPVGTFGNPASQDEDTNAATVSVYLMRAFDCLTGTFISNQASAVRRNFSPVGLAESRGSANVPMTFAVHAGADRLVNPNQINFLKSALGAFDYSDANIMNLTKRHITWSVAGYDHGFIKSGLTGNFAVPFDRDISPKVVLWFNSRLK